MARTRQDRKLVSPSVRVALRVRPEPYWRTISKGLAIGYRKGMTGGTWIARHFSVETKRRVESIGVADDHENADGIRVLSFEQAQKKVHKWLARLTAEDTGGVVAGPYTVARAMDDYITDRESSTRKPKARDRGIVEAHIKPTLGRIELNKLTQGKVKAWRDACDAAELEGVTFHILRHTYASHSLMNGMTIEVLAQQLGHKDTRITMRHYAHLCPTFKQESVRRNAPSFGFVSKPGPVLVDKAS